MNACDAYIVEVLGMIAHGFCSHQSLFRNGNVRGSGGRNENLALAVLSLVFLNQNHAGVRIEDCLTLQFFDRTENFTVGTRNQDVVLMGEHALNDSQNLTNRFAPPKDYFGESLPKWAMMVNSRKTHVFKRQMLQLLQAIVDRKRTFFDSRENFSDFVFCHEPVIRVTSGLLGTSARPSWRFCLKLVQLKLVQH